jgi:hypothetical protein
MSVPSDCVTEVTFHFSLPVDELYQRLHQHLPSSPYTQGAIYVPVRDFPESPCQQGSRAVLPTNTAATPTPPAPILLLRGKFKWRFGGELEQSISPPWSWMSEELCGKPYPYIARDFNSLHSMVGSTSTPRCPYIIHSKLFPRWLLDGACLLTRRSPCVIHDSAQLVQSHCVRLSQNDTAT